MPRIPYVTDDEAGDGPLVTAIRKRRGGGLLNLDRQLLHSPPFAEGWNDNGEYLGRPVDVAQLPDGSILVSDDLAGALYRIWYDGK